MKLLIIMLLILPLNAIAQSDWRLQQLESKVNELVSDRNDLASRLKQRDMIINMLIDDVMKHTKQIELLDEEIRQMKHDQIMKKLQRMK